MLHMHRTGWCQNQSIISREPFFTRSFVRAYTFHHRLKIELESIGKVRHFKRIVATLHTRTIIYLVSWLVLFVVRRHSILKCIHAILHIESPKWVYTHSRKSKEFPFALVFILLCPMFRMQTEHFIPFVHVNLMQFSRTESIKYRVMCKRLPQMPYTTDDWTQQKKIQSLLARTLPYLSFVYFLKIAPKTPKHGINAMCNGN